jgi:hypothetical protein
MEKTAFHEAGHAVVGWLFGLPPKRMYLNLETEGGEVVPVDPFASRLCLVKRIAYLYAGPVSEEIFKGPASSRRCSGDHANVHVLLEKNGTPEEEPEGQGLQKRAYALVEKLLRRQESRVERVAKRLMQPPHKMNPARFKRLMHEG